MTDYTELKRLAEAAQYENHEFQQSLVVATRKFFEGCIPEQILELITERDQLKAEVDRLAKKSEEWEQAAMHWMHRSDHLRDKVTTIRNAFRPLLAHWDDLKPGDSIRVDAAREAMSKETVHD